MSPKIVEKALSIIMSAFGDDSNTMSLSPLGALSEFTGDDLRQQIENLKSPPLAAIEQGAVDWLILCRLG